MSDHQSTAHLWCGTGYIAIGAFYLLDAHYLLGLALVAVGVAFLTKDRRQQAKTRQAEAAR